MFSGSLGEISMSSRIYDEDDMRGQVFTNVAIYKVGISVMRYWINLFKITFNVMVAILKPLK